MIAICPNPYRDLNYELTKKACALLQSEGFETAVCPVFAEETDAVPGEVRLQPLETVAGDCSLILVIGGDGTILSVVRQMHALPVPVLGINMGTKGFLANLEPGDLPMILRAARGDMGVSRRMMLQIQVQRDGKTILEDQALNDLVLHGYGDCIQLTAWCDGDKMTRFSGDGIILATPTGSTGYAMSAGGPIVEPTARAIIVSPICAHMLGARTFVVSAERAVSVRAEISHGRRAYISVDGSNVGDLAHGDTVIVRQSSHTVMMADLGLRSFYDIAYDKLT